MSSIKSIIKSLAEKGKVEHEVTIQDSVFLLETITSEEQFLVESISSVEQLKEKYKSEDRITSYMDTLKKMRNLSHLAFIVKSIDGIKIVNDDDSPEEVLKKRLDFRDELATLPTAFFDALQNGYRELYDKNKEFYKDAKENLGK